MGLKRMFKKYLPVRALMAAFVLLLCVHVSEAQVFDIPYEGEAPTRTLLLQAQKAQAIVILFPGGQGMIRLAKDGTAKSTHTFVRSQNEWAQYGIHSVLVDSPNNLGNTRGNFRDTADHLGRVEAVIKFYKEKFNLHAWIFGHSMGSSTVSFFSNKSKEYRNQVAGGIIAGTLQEVGIDDENDIPLLAIHHKYDGCRSTPSFASERIIKNRLKEFPTRKSKLVLIEGGDDIGDPCQSAGYHGFAQKEPDFIKEAATFILGR
jgi:hypothetical protein